MIMFSKNAANRRNLRHPREISFSGKQPELGRTRIPDLSRGKLAERSWLRCLVWLPSRGRSFRQGARNRHPPCPICPNQTDRPAGFISPLALLPEASDRPGEEF